MFRLFPLFFSLALATSAQQYRAFWSDGFHEGFKTPAQIDRMVEDLVTARANAVFMEARLRSNSYFNLSLEPFAEDPEVPPGFDPLEYLIQKAHARSIEVHAWYVVYPMWRAGSPPANPRHLYYSHGPAASGAERWLTVNSSGGEALSLDPGHPGVLPYLIDVFLEPVKHYNLDGVHLDYIRYPEDADYGYNPTTLERFARLENRGGPPTRTDPAWSQWRRDQVTALVRQLYLRLQQLRPSVKLSVAAITWGNGPLTDAEFRSKDAYSRVFQDWRGWLEEGILDFTIPMNYFRESQYAAYLDRWTEYQKDHQYGRAYVNGLGNYLNTLPQTLAQLDRVFKPSARSNIPLGVCFYSYPATRSDAPEKPNPEFYSAIGAYFREPAAVPELPWKIRPQKGCLMGALEIAGGVEWWRDGVTVHLDSREGRLQSRRTDASGFFGFVDLPPGEYQVALVANGRTLFASGWRRVEAGVVTEIPVRLGAEDFQTALPRLSAGSLSQASPGDVVRLSGANLAADYGFAVAVPLPRELAGTMILVNGTQAPLFEIGEDFVEFQLPFTALDQWRITARRAGFDSEPIFLQSVPATPVIREVRRNGAALEIIATGLGLTDPPAAAGSGGNAEEPFHRTVLPVTVLINGEPVTPSFAGLEPWLPGRYLVRVTLPGAPSGELRIQAGDAVSAPVRFD